MEISKKESTRKQVKKNSDVDGDELIYKLLTEFTKLPDQISTPLLELMIKRSAIWFRPECYAQTPLMLPWVVRDPKSRGPKGLDEWSSPNSLGYLRDDNSLIKPIPRKLKIVGPKDSWYSGKLVGAGFTASHIWRETGAEKLASREPTLNTFVPNLVWLPKQIAKLTDREGSRSQLILQSMSWELYRNFPVRTELKNQIENIWKVIPKPKTKIDLDRKELNFFLDTPSHHLKLKEKLSSTLIALKCAVAGTPYPENLKLETRYREGLHKVEREKLNKLIFFLKDYDVEHSL